MLKTFWTVRASSFVSKVPRQRFSNKFLPRQYGDDQKTVLSTRTFDRKPAKPVISIPVKVQTRAEKRQQRLKEKKIAEAPYFGDRFAPIIVCRRKELNHYSNQAYHKYKKLPLASEHWLSRRANNDHFTIVPHKGYQFRDDNTPDSFSEYDLNPQLVENLRSCGYKRPTLIQAMALSKLLQEKCSCVIATETGNGKSLAFLIPLIQTVLSYKEYPEIRERPDNSPLAIVVTPGRELADQLFDLARSVTEGLDVSVASTRRSRKSRPMDILIGTFGTLNKHFESHDYKKNFVRALVFDEADTLLDDTFNEETVPFLQKFVTHGTRPAQMMLVAATFPTSLHNILTDVCSVEDLERITTSHLHKVLPHITQKFIRIPATKKLETLIEIVSKEVARKRPTLIFSNKSPCAHFLHKYLLENNIPCTEYHSGVPDARRSQDLKKFLLGKVNVISCTDLISRGIDTFNVKHVINFDFPMNMSDYVHRVGRVGRVSSPFGCKVTNFVRNPLAVRLVQQIEESVRLRTSLPNVNNNIIRIIEHREDKKMEKSAMNSPQPLVQDAENSEEDDSEYL